MNGLAQFSRRSYRPFTVYAGTSWRRHLSAQAPGRHRLARGPGAQGTPRDSSPSLSPTSRRSRLYEVRLPPSPPLTPPLIFRGCKGWTQPQSVSAAPVHVVPSALPSLLLRPIRKHKQKIKDRWRELKVRGEAFRSILMGGDEFPSNGPPFIYLFGYQRDLCGDSRTGPNLWLPPPAF